MGDKLDPALLFTRHPYQFGIIHGVRAGHVINAELVNHYPKKTKTVTTTAQVLHCFTPHSISAGTPLQVIYILATSPVTIMFPLRFST